MGVGEEWSGGEGGMLGVREGWSGGGRGMGWSPLLVAVLLHLKNESKRT